MTPVSREVFRPRILLIWASTLSAIVVIGCALAWWALGPDIRARFHWFQLATLLAIAGGGIFVMMAMALSRVVVDAEQISVRNAVLTRRLSWAQVRDVRWGPGAPWAHLVLDDDPEDPTRVPLLALQTVDRGRTESAVRRLRQLIRERRAEVG